MTFSIVSLPHIVPLPPPVMAMESLNKIGITSLFAIQFNSIQFNFTSDIIKNLGTIIFINFFYLYKNMIYILRIHQDNHSTNQFKVCSCK